MTEKNIYNKYTFNKIGLNIILGQQGMESDETNGVGKTALIECIKYCLGSSLPQCFKSKAELAKHDIFIVLDVINKGKNIKIGRSLYDDTFAYTLEHKQILYTLKSWEMHTTEEFKGYIQNLMYSNIEEDDTLVPPNFPSVREYLMRDEKSGFQDLTLSKRSAVLSSQILSFLSLLPFNFEKNLNSQKKIIKDLQNELSIIREIGKDIKLIEKQNKDTLAEIEELKSILESADISEKIKYDDKKYSQLKNRLSILQGDIHRLEYAKSQHEKNIDLLKENIEKAREIVNVKDFFNQILNYFPDQLSKNYDEMKEFYNFMIDNRGSYFKQKINEIIKALEPMYNEKEQCLKELSSCTALIKNSDLVIDLREITNQINEKYKLLAEFNYKIEKYKSKKRIEDDLGKQKEYLEELTQKYLEIFNRYSSNINNICKHYYELNKIAYNEEGELQYIFEDSVKLNASTGRVKIQCSLPDEGAHGRFLMKINMFDLALLLNRIDYKKGLTFLFHDGSYSKPAPSIKGNMLEYIDQYLKKSELGQYFITINTEELTKQDLDELSKRGSIVSKLERTTDNKRRSLGIKY